MTEHAYDAQTPYVVTGEHTDIIYARFRHEEDAQAWADHSGLSMIDTTPKPKIPEGAHFIYWSRGPEPVEYYARRIGHPGNKVWRNDEGEQVSEDDLLADIGDAEVTVLVPKEES